MTTATLAAPAVPPVPTAASRGVLTGRAINDLLTTTEAALLLDCSARHIARLCQRGEIPAYKVGTDWRIDPVALARYTFAPRGRPPLDGPRGRDHGPHRDREPIPHEGPVR